MSEASVSEWSEVAELAAIPRLGARVVRHNGLRVALFRTEADEVFALEDKCPHRGGHLSQGIVCGRQVTCPMHGWNIELGSGRACAPDEGAAATLPVRVDAGRVYLQLP